MRTNITIDEKLMTQAQALTGITTKKAVVEEALRLLIRIQQQIALRELRGQLHWEGNLDEMREDRFEPAH